MAYQNSPKIVTSGLVLCLDAANTKSYPGSGTSWADLSRNVPAGTFTGSPPFNQNNNGCISFDGSSQYTNYGDYLKFAYTDSFTLEAWVYYGKDSTGYACIISKEDYNGSSASFGYGLKVDKSNNLPYLVVTGPSPTTTRSYRYGSVTVNDNKWHHLVGVYIGGGTPSINFYTDGVLTNGSASLVANGGTPNSKSLYIGASDAGLGAAINANIASARIYNYPLTSTEILQNYNATRARFDLYVPNIITDNLVLNLNAGQLPSYLGTNTTWYDLGSGANNATLTNGPTFNNTGGGNIVFDGTNDSAVFSTITLGSNANWTINILTNATSFAPDSYTNILSNNSGGPVSNAMGIASNGKITYTYYDSTWKFIYGNSTLSTGTWYYLTWVNRSSDSTTTMYVNGAADSSAQSTSSANSHPINAIGRNWATYYNGKVASVTYYNTNHSAAQVATNFNAVRGRFGI